MKQVIEYIPINLQEQPLFVEICDVIQQTIDNDEIMLNDIIKKYKSTFEENQTIIELIFKEYGYDYIYETIKDITDDEAASLVGFIGLIHLFKGHKLGLQTVLDLLGFIDTEITEWWEESPKAEPDTFDMVTNISNLVIDPKSISRFFIFVRNYVYPVLEYWEFIYDATIGNLVILSAGFMEKEYESIGTCYPLWSGLGGFMDREYECIITALI
jgi:hypothetical protein